MNLIYKLRPIITKTFDQRPEPTDHFIFLNFIISKHASAILSKQSKFDDQEYMVYNLQKVRLKFIDTGEYREVNSIGRVTNVRKKIREKQWVLRIYKIPKTLLVTLGIKVNQHTRHFSFTKV